MNTTGQLTSNVTSLLSEGVNYAQTLPGNFRTAILTGLERTRTLLGVPALNPKSAPLVYAAASRQLQEVEQKVSQAIEGVPNNQHGELTSLLQVQAICRLSLNELALRRIRRLNA